MKKQDVMSDRAVMAEISVFRMSGWVYYRHEGGEVFASDARELGKRNPTIKRNQHVPTKAKPYSPTSSATIEKIDAWTDACDDLARASVKHAGGGL